MNKERYILIGEETFRGWTNRLIYGARNQEQVKLVGIEMHETLEQYKKPAEGQIQAKINEKNELEI